MMSLVAYDSSDETDDNEHDDETKDEKTSKVSILSNSFLSHFQETSNDQGSVDRNDVDESLLLKLPTTLHSVTEKTIDFDSKGKKGLFSTLPPPKMKNIDQLNAEVEEETPRMVNKHQINKKETVKITLPALSQFKENDEMEPERKKLKLSSKSSGLFALLPAPKHMTVKEAKRNLVPNAVSKKPTKTSNSSPSTHKPKTTAALINYVDSGDDSDENNDGNFFSLNDDSAPKTAHLLLNETLICSGTDTLLSTGVEDSTNNVAIDQPLTLCSEFPPSTLSNSNEEWQQQSMSSTEMKNDILLDEEALQRLCGRRATRDKQAMQIIDVSGDAIMPDPNEWLTKQLTEEQQQKSHSHSHRKNEGPTTQQRRKHQITYLAFQAKENELELKNQWSQNRMSRKQTQSKYGF